MRIPIRCLLSVFGAATFAFAAPAQQSAPPAPQPPPSAERPPQPQPKERVTFLGVTVQPVPPALAAQLGLAVDVGLVVEHIVPETPAAAALQPHDVLLKCDDQMLIEPRQLAVLVRNHQEGDEVVFSLIRGGKAQTAKVKLVKREMPKHLPGHFRPEIPQLFEERQRALRTWPQRMSEARLIGPHEGGGTMSIRSAGGSNTGLGTLRHGNSVIMNSDEAGSLELKFEDGKRFLTAKDKQGTVQFSGPINTPEERKAIPEQVRPRLERMMNLRGANFSTAGEGRALPPLPEGQRLPAAGEAGRMGPPPAF
ncbi:MAG: PDZ domain-containing protein [Opitutae bacterium]|nr:PDZ domain-containing protein [Opitutae bacterium]